MVPTGSTSVMPRLSQRLMLMLTTPVSMVPTGDTLPTHTLMATLPTHTHLTDTAHTDTAIPHTGATDMVAV